MQQVQLRTTPPAGLASSSTPEPLGTFVFLARGTAPDVLDCRPGTCTRFFPSLAANQARPSGMDIQPFSQLKMGAVQGMLCSSVAAANVAEMPGVVNLPFVVDTFDKLDTFRNTPALWNEFRNSALSRGLMVLDMTGYGTCGGATTKPERNSKERSPRPRRRASASLR